MEKPHITPAGYLVVYVLLMLLLGLTILAALLHLGPVSLLIALAIAAIKAALVALYFMHIRFSSRVTWVFSGAGILWLGILFVLTSSDFLTRGWLPRSEELTHHGTFIPPPPGLPHTTPEAPIQPIDTPR